MLVNKIISVVNEEAAMAVTEAPTVTVGARVSRELRDELDKLAKSTGRNRAALVEEALRRFVEVERWQISLIEGRLRQADVGEIGYATDDEVARVYAKLNVPRRDQAERAVI